MPLVFSNVTHDLQHEGRFISLLPVLASFVAAPALPAAAAPPTEIVASPFEIDLELDTQLMATSLLVSLGPSLLERPTAHLQVEPLSMVGLPRIDRAVVGNDSNGARSLSDILVYSHIALPQVLNALDVLLSRDENRWKTLGTESLVLAQSLAVTLMATSLLKTTVGRPRPYMFDVVSTPEERAKRSSHESFPSGHTSMAFAAATSYSYLFQRKHPDSPLVWPVWIGTHALASTVGLLRVEGGRHFWTDVLTGAALGSTIGFLVPYLRTRDIDLIPSWLGEARVVPSVNSRGFGLTAMWIF